MPWLPGCLPDTDPIHKVTIIPRGRALGLTMQLPIDEKYTHSKSYLQNTICILFGGRIAEKTDFQRDHHRRRQRYRTGLGLGPQDGL